MCRLIRRSIAAMARCKFRAQFRGLYPLQTKKPCHIMLKSILHVMTHGGELIGHAVMKPLEVLQVARIWAFHAPRTDHARTHVVTGWLGVVYLRNLHVSLRRCSGARSEAPSRQLGRESLHMIHGPCLDSEHLSPESGARSTASAWLPPSPSSSGRPPPHGASSCGGPAQGQ
ncbi:hypothetical protein OBBRIDRAFT_356246 [Obba rivulosa]|uniref:Uncharacterized protein n=1 Tax=Obba rivulosa TaxID=1052685 RepID=A0A8E2AMZ2_9APHY|nr:hypothetical protein OBBRIDRAFT_356246 [Obba rivulosa]